MDELWTYSVYVARVVVKVSSRLYGGVRITRVTSTEPIGYSIFIMDPDHVECGTWDWIPQVDSGSHVQTLASRHARHLPAPASLSCVRPCPSLPPTLLYLN